MKHVLLMSSLLMGTVLAQTSLLLTAQDGVKVHAERHENPAPKAVLLMFHQAGSNKAEHAPIAPEFVKLGFLALAIDQRSGGSMFGSNNETVQGLKQGYTFLEALPDVEAAVLWAKTTHPNLPIWLLGSSYSTELVLLTAAKHPDIQGVMVFSPGDGIGRENLIKDTVKTLQNTAVFVTSARTARESDLARSIFEALGSKHKVQFVPTSFGAHGASILRPEKAQLGGLETWEAVRKFVRAHLQ